MVAIDIKILFLIVASIPMSASVEAYYPKLCIRRYTECLQDRQSSSLQCGTARVVCLTKYCMIQMKGILKHQMKNKSVIQRSIAKCLVKHPAARMSEMLTEFGE
ncbi:hypothetical protein ScPMuIL_011207 [Solemya velum]